MSSPSTLIFSFILLKIHLPGRHLHLVVVTDKTSRGEVGALIAKILTRCFLVLLFMVILVKSTWWCLVNGDYDQVGRQRCDTEARLEMEASESFASHTCLSSRHPTDYSGLIEITTDETLFRFAKHCHTDWSKLAQVYQILHISLWSYNCTRWTGSW